MFHHTIGKLTGYLCHGVIGKAITVMNWLLVRGGWMDQIMSSTIFVTLKINHKTILENITIKTYLNFPTFLQRYALLL